MNRGYKGTIVEESLEDNRILNRLTITNVRISDNDNPYERWHLYTVSVSKEDIELIAQSLREGKWYMHFWSGNEVIAVFKKQTFTFDYANKETWEEAIDYGLSLGIPLEQLDFIITD